jgi:hypothetical protein
VRPSALLGLDGSSWESFCLDEAVYVFGNWISGELHKVQGKSEAAVQRGQEMRLNQLLGVGTMKGRFADPAATFFSQQNDVTGGENNT